MRKPGEGRPSGRCGERGAVLMEYVVLSMTLLLALVGVNWIAAELEMEPLFDPGGAVTGNFGLIGNTLMDWYHRIVDVVALPVP